MVQASLNDLLAFGARSSTAWLSCFGLGIDTDPQASVSRLLGIQPHRLDVADTLACIVDSPTPLKPRATHIDGLHIVPASMGLTNLEVSILSMFRDNQGDRIGPLMESAFASVEADYDIILCDFQRFR